MDLHVQCDYFVGVNYTVRYISEFHICHIIYRIATMRCTDPYETTVSQLTANLLPMRPSYFVTWFGDYSLIIFVVNWAVDAVPPGARFSLHSPIKPWDIVLPVWSQELDFQRNVSWSVFSECRWEVIILSVDIGGIVDHHSLDTHFTYPTNNLNGQNVSFLLTANQASKLTLYLAGLS